MRKSRRKGLATLAVVVVLGGVGYRWGPYLWARSQVPMTFEEADLDKDGWVSLTEASYIASSGTRAVGRCTQYFAYKDGLELKTVCPP
jgi:hypothetical protein